MPDLFGNIKNMWNGADEFFDRKLKEQTDPNFALDNAADEAITRHQQAVEAVEIGNASLAKDRFNDAQKSYVKVMWAACQAKGLVTNHTDRIMRLMEYRLPGDIERSQIEKIMDMQSSLHRKMGFESLFMAFATA